MSMQRYPKTNAVPMVRPAHHERVLNRCAQFKMFKAGAPFKNSSQNICLTFARDRQYFLRWVFEAKKRSGLSCSITL
jgi:hypothetical protein